MPSSSRAESKPQKVSFETADGVELQGVFYPARNGGGRPSVILLHSLFKDLKDPKEPKYQFWADLAQLLADDEDGGFNVLFFDFRGHGNSFEIKDTEKFWNNAVNAKYMANLAAKKSKKITIKDISGSSKSGYFPMLANDIMAARNAIDLKNDAKQTNSSSIYLVGATDTASLAMLFLAAEWTRPSILQQGDAVRVVPYERRFWVPAAEEAGKDIAGCVWLSAARHPSLPSEVVKKFVSNSPNQRLREENPMLFLYGDGDKSTTTGAASSKYFINEVLIAKGSNSPKLNPLKFTELKEIPKTPNVGVDLLGKNLGTEKIIIDQLKQYERDRKSKNAVDRFFTKPPLINATAFGVTQ